MILSVTIGREALDMEPLVITNSPFGTSLYLPEDGLAEPSFMYRTAYAPESTYYAGQRALSAVLDASALPLVVYAKGDSTVALGLAMGTLQDAVSQWAGTDVTVTIDGVSRTWQTSAPVWPQWGPFDSGMARAFLQRADVTLPINPPGV